MRNVFRGYLRRAIGIAFSLLAVTCYSDVIVQIQYGPDPKQSVVNRIWFEPALETGPSSGTPANLLDYPVEDLIAQNRALFESRLVRRSLYAFRVPCVSVEACQALKMPAWMAVAHATEKSLDSPSAHDLVHRRLYAEFDPWAPQTWRAINDRSSPWEYWRYGRTLRSRYLIQNGEDRYDIRPWLDVRRIHSMHRYERNLLGIEFLPAGKLIGPAIELVAQMDPEAGKERGQTSELSWEEIVWERFVKPQKGASDLEISRLRSLLGRGDATYVLRIVLQNPKTLSPTAHAAISLIRGFDVAHKELERLTESYQELRSELLDLQHAAVSREIDGIIARLQEEDYFNAIDPDDLSRFIFSMLGISSVTDGRLPNGQQRLVIVDNPRDPTLARSAAFLESKGWKVRFAPDEASMVRAIYEHFSATGTPISLAFLSHGEPRNFSKGIWNFGSGTEKSVGSKIAGKVESVLLFSCSVGDGVKDTAPHTMRHISRYFSNPHLRIPVRGFDLPVYVNPDGSMFVDPRTIFVEVKVR